MTEAMNQCATGFGGVYDFYIERPWLSKLIGRGVWGIDLAPMYASIDSLGDLSDGVTVLDVPCGGGLSLRSLRRGQSIRFLAADIDPKMLDRTRSKSRSRGLVQVETIEADMRHLPIGDSSVDHLCSYSGLHMINDPEVAIGEFARVIKTGGTIAGSSFVGDGTRRKRLLFKMGERRGIAKAPADGSTIERWLEDAGFTDIEVRGRGFVDFRATRS